jgi:hypothetical protein
VRVLYLAGSGLHGHDYGNAFLFDGLVSVLGYHNVIDWPANPTYHLGDPAERDACSLDSDLFYPTRPAPESVEYDLVVIAIHTAEVRHTVRALPKYDTTPIVAVDYSDHVGNQRGLYEACAGRPLAAYFKRELPLGANWGYPLPLCYPASRVPTPMPSKALRVFYHATAHGFDGPGRPRMQIVEGLQAAVGRGEITREQLDCGLYRGQEKGTRPSPEEYHARMAEALVGISWNGHPYVTQWDNNRFWEQFAYGLCQVAEAPRIQIPEAPEDGVHCFYVQRSERVADVALWLMDREDRARQIAAAGHAHFLRHHTSEARARYLLDIVGRLGSGRTVG